MSKDEKEKRLEYLKAKAEAASYDEDIAEELVEEKIEFPLLAIKIQEWKEQYKAYYIGKRALNLNIIHEVWKCFYL